MKKILVAIITTVLLFTTYASCSASSLPSPSPNIKDQVSNDSTQDPNLTLETLNNYNNGTVYYGNQNAEISNTTSLEWIAEIMAFAIAIIPCSINALLCIAIMPDTVPKAETFFFTIERLLSGKIDLFDINIFDIPTSDENISSEDVNDSSINLIIKKNVAKWFYALRNFAIVALLAVLIYIGILMAISATSKDKARYKNMLINWFVSFILIFVIQYILIIAITASNQFIKMILQISDSMEIVISGNESANVNPNTGVLEEQKRELELELVFGYVNSNGTSVPGILSNIPGSTGWTRLAITIVYCVFVYYQVKFFFMYLKRLFIVGFLTAISPLITITYSIDKARDTQAQAYKTWFKEIMINIFIQPIHLVFFLIVINSTKEIILRTPIFAILLIGSLSRAESIIRKLFKVDRTNSLGSLKRKRR